MRRGGSRVGPGSFTARLTVDGVEMLQAVQVEIDPEHPDASWIRSEERAAWQEHLEALERDEAEAAERSLIERWTCARPRRGARGSAEDLGHAARGVSEALRLDPDRVEHADEDVAERRRLVSGSSRA